VWNKLSLPAVDRIRAQLRDKALNSHEKQGLWRALALNVFTQLFVNMYSSEIFKLVFLISTHLAAKKDQDGENCELMLRAVDRLNNSIQEEVVISGFISEKIQHIIHTY
jgi:hypothetical protein